MDSSPVSPTGNGGLDWDVSDQWQVSHVTPARPNKVNEPRILKFTKLMYCDFICIQLI